MTDDLKARCREAGADIERLIQQMTMRFMLRAEDADGCESGDPVDQVMAMVAGMLRRADADRDRAMATVRTLRAALVDAECWCGAYPCRRCMVLDATEEWAT